MIESIKTWKKEELNNCDNFDKELKNLKQEILQEQENVSPGIANGPKIQSEFIQWK